MDIIFYEIKYNHRKSSLKITHTGQRGKKLSRCAAGRHMMKYRRHISSLVNWCLKSEHILGKYLISNYSFRLLSKLTRMATSNDTTDVIDDMINDDTDMDTTEPLTDPLKVTPEKPNDPGVSKEDQDMEHDGMVPVTNMVSSPDERHVNEIDKQPRHYELDPTGSRPEKSPTEGEKQVNKDKTTDNDKDAESDKTKEKMDSNMDQTQDKPQTITEGDKPEKTVRDEFDEGTEQILKTINEAKQQADEVNQQLKKRKSKKKTPQQNTKPATSAIDAQRPEKTPEEPKLQAKRVLFRTGSGKPPVDLSTLSTKEFRQVMNEEVQRRQAEANKKKAEAAKKKAEAENARITRSLKEKIYEELHNTGGDVNKETQEDKNETNDSEELILNADSQDRKGLESTSPTNKKVTANLGARPKEGVKMAEKQKSSSTKTSSEAGKTLGNTNKTPTKPGNSKKQIEKSPEVVDIDITPEKSKSVVKSTVVAVEKKSSKREAILNKEEEKLQRNQNKRARIIRSLMVNQIKERIRQIEELTLKEYSYKKREEDLERARSAMPKHKREEIIFRPNGRLSNEFKRVGLEQLGLFPEEILDNYQPQLDYLQENIVGQRLPFEEVTQEFVDLIRTSPDWWHDSVRWSITNLLTKLRIRPVEFIIKREDERTNFGGNNNRGVHQTAYVSVYDTWAHASNSEPTKMLNRQRNKRFLETDIAEQLEKDYREGGIRGVRSALEKLSKACQSDIQKVKNMATENGILRMNNLSSFLSRKVVEALRFMSRDARDEDHKIHEMDNFELINISMEPLRSAHDKEKLSKKYCDVTRMTRKILGKKNLLDVEVVDQEIWDRFGTSIMKRMKNTLEVYPVISVDQEYDSALSCLGMIDETTGPLVYIFRMICPLKVRALLADPSITTCGDESALIDMLGYTPEGFVSLAAFLIDLPSQGTEQHLKSGVEALARKFLNLDLTHLKSNKPSELQEHGPNLERIYRGLIKCQGWLRKATYMYAALDPYIYIVCFQFILQLWSDLKIKMYEVHNHKSRINLVINYVQKLLISKRVIDDTKIQNSEILHDEKHWITSRMALKMTKVRVVETKYTTQ